MQFHRSRAPYASMLVIILKHLDGICEASVLPLLLGITEAELTECIKGVDLFQLTTIEGRSYIRLKHLIDLDDGIINEALFSSSLFSENTTASAVYTYYAKDFRGFLDRSEKAVKALIKHNRPLVIRRTYDALAYAILRMSVPIDDKDFCFYFIDKCMEIQREIIKFPSNSRYLLLLFSKIKGIAHYIGDMRSIGYINVSMGAINHLMRPAAKTNLFHANMKKGKDIIMSLGDNDIKMMAAPAIVLYFYLEGEPAEGLNFAYPILFSDDNDGAHINTALYSYTTVCATRMGNYRLAESVLLSGLKKIKLSERDDINTLKAFLAYVYIFQHRYDEALQIIEKSLGLRDSQILTYADLWCSRLLCFYHYLTGDIQKSYDNFQNLLKVNSYISISHSNYLVAPFVIELLCAYYIHGYPSPQELTIQDELKYAFTSPSKPVRATAYRIAGQIRAHEFGWGDPSVREYLEKSLQHLRNSSSPPEKAKTLIALSCMYRAKKNKGEAQRAATDAWNISQQYGQPIWPDDLTDLVKHSATSQTSIRDSLSDYSIKFIRNLRSQTTFNANSEFANILLTSLLATVGSTIGCVYHADGPDLQCLHKVEICEEGKETITDACWKRLAQNALNQGQSLTKQDLFSPGDSNDIKANAWLSNDMRGEAIALYVDALDYGKYIFCLSNSSVPDLPTCVEDHQIDFLENYLSAQICINKVHKKSWYEHIDNQSISIPHADSVDNLYKYSQNSVGQVDSASDFLSTEQADFDGNILYKSRAMKELIEIVDSVARKDATVIILGESGVGKELVAKRLHDRSQRKGNFVKINLANIPYELFESECYGHEKGSFTGANRQKKGLFEVADSGTLFIDEIGDVPTPLQVKLLRVIQEKQFMRVGGLRTLSSDFRLITATNRDLPQEINHGRFREDLYYRLNVISIHIPPLRERPDDILFLADHFLRYYSRYYKINYKPISPELQQTIFNYSWPGNVRELKNYIERYCVMSDQHVLPVPPDGRGSGLSTLNKDKIEQAMIEKPTLKQLNDVYFEYIYIEKKGAVGGSDGIASTLGMSRTTAYAWIERLDLKNKYKMVLTQNTRGVAS